MGWVIVRSAEAETYTAISIDSDQGMDYATATREVERINRSIAACKSAYSFWGRYIDRVGASESWASAVYKKLREAVEGS